MATKLMMQETFTNETKGHLIDQTDWYEPYTTDRGRLFRDLQKEYGRCTSRVSHDGPNGTKAVGWYFQKRMEYEDWRPGMRDRYYVRGVWVEIAECEEEEDDFDC